MGGKLGALGVLGEQVAVVDSLAAHPVLQLDAREVAGADELGLQVTTELQLQGEALAAGVGGEREALLQAHGTVEVPLDKARPDVFHTHTVALRRHRGYHGGPLGTASTQEVQRALTHRFGMPQVDTRRIQGHREVVRRILRRNLAAARLHPILGAGFLLAGLQVGRAQAGGHWRGRLIRTRGRRCGQRGGRHHERR